ncbi:MAG: secretory protein, partial [Clostridium sp.]|nr:secretory protein [Clostridium sp.]
QTTGYQIQYSTDKNFKKNNKTVTVSSNKTTSKTISKLSGKKKYYVRIRTYKTVSGTKYYSSWSSVKTVTTKK